MDYTKGINNFHDIRHTLKTRKEVMTALRKEKPSCVDDRETKELVNDAIARVIEIEEIANRTYEVGKEKIENEQNIL